MITIDGAYGEGGGQILRTSASLAALTGQTVRVENVRAGRKVPGLRPQHLTAIQAAMRLCNGQLQGGEVGSTEVTMRPGSPPQTGEYRFDIGTAGSTGLVLQTVLYPLLRAEGPSRVTVIGGTHNEMAPTAHFVQDTFLPVVDLGTTYVLHRLGFYPRGNGEVELEVNPGMGRAIRQMVRGEREQVTATVALSDRLPGHILTRAGETLQTLADRDGWRLEFRTCYAPSHCPGMAVHLHATYAGGVAGFSELGSKGVPTETVIERAWAELMAFDASVATVDEHLADQLILPSLLADAPSRYRPQRFTEHFRTMAWLVPQFGLGEVRLDETAGTVEVLPKRVESP